MERMERRSGTVERFVCESGGRVEGSKCRAVLGTAFAGVGRSWVVECGGECARLYRLAWALDRAAQTQRSGVIMNDKHRNMESGLCGSTNGMFPIAGGTESGGMPFTCKLSTRNKSVV